MPIRDRRPEDDRPLFRSVNEQRLMGPASMEPEDGETSDATGQTRTASRAGEAGQAGGGPIARAVDRAQENNWVYPSMADKARERGLLDKADKVLGRIKAQLGGR